LQFTAPIFVILLMWAIKKERPKKLDIMACLIVFSGIICFFVDGLLVGNMLGNILAVFSGVCYAGVFMMNTAKGADALSSCFLGQLAAGIAFSPFCLRETDFSIPVVSAVLLLGVVQVGAAYIPESVKFICYQLHFLLIHQHKSKPNRMIFISPIG